MSTLKTHDIDDVSPIEGPELWAVPGDRVYHVLYDNEGLCIAVVGNVITVLWIDCSNHPLGFDIVWNVKFNDNQNV